MKKLFLLIKRTTHYGRCSECESVNIQQVCPGGDYYCADCGTDC
jgi:hypothetical protein